MSMVLGPQEYCGYYPTNQDTLLKQLQTKLTLTWNNGFPLCFLHGDRPLFSRIWRTGEWLGKWWCFVLFCFICLYTECLPRASLEFPSWKVDIWYDMMYYFQFSDHQARHKVPLVTKSSCQLCVCVCYVWTYYKHIIHIYTHTHIYTVSCSSGWPQTHYIDEEDTELQPSVTTSQCWDSSQEIWTV